MSSKMLNALNYSLVYMPSLKVVDLCRLSLVAGRWSLGTGRSAPSHNYRMDRCMYNGGMPPSHVVRS